MVLILRFFRVNVPKSAGLSPKPTGSTKDCFSNIMSYINGSFGLNMPQGFQPVSGITRQIVDGDNKCLIWECAPAIVCAPAIAREDLSKCSFYVCSNPTGRTGGNYMIDLAAYNSIRELERTKKAWLTSWLVEQRAQGVEVPVITSEIMEYIKSLRRPLSVHKRAERLLRFLATLPWQVGLQVENVHPETHSAALAWSESIDWREIHYFFDYLVDKGWLEGAKHPMNGSFGYTVSMEGYTQIADQTTNSDSAQGFVAMWFNDDTNDVFAQGIAPGIEDAGYSPLRIDRKPDADKIDDDIISEIRRSRFLVADFTHGADGARGGVYYEAGFARGLEIPVIFTCRDDMVNKLHFDTRQYAHIVWQEPAELRHMLCHRIMARIGGGPGTQST